MIVEPAARLLNTFCSTAVALPLIVVGTIVTVTDSVALPEVFVAVTLNVAVLVPADMAAVSRASWVGA